MRTTTLAVSKIIEVDATINEGDLSPFIETASAVVDDVCVPLEYNDTRLELIERWLAAHFYAVRDMRRSDEKAGSVSESYQYHVGAGLESTMYGTQAIALDTKGGLAGWNKAMKDGNTQRPSAFWLGTKRC